MSDPVFTEAQVETAVAGATYTHTYLSGNTYTTEFGDSEGNVNWVELHYHGGSIESPIGAIKVIEAEGGSEGDGEHAHLVIQTVASGQYFRIDGYYQSYDGLYLDGDLREVRETIKTVKVYE